MLKQKYINVIRTCLKMNRAFGNEKSKMDIEETLKAFDEEIKKDRKLHEEYIEIKNRQSGVQTVPPSQSLAPKPPGKQY